MGFSNNYVTSTFNKEYHREKIIKIGWKISTPHTKKTELPFHILVQNWRKFFTLLSTYIQYVTAFCQYGLFSENFPILSAKSINWQQHGASNITVTKPTNLKVNQTYFHSKFILIKICKFNVCLFDGV